MWGDFSTPLRFARNDVAREVSTVRYPLSAYREGKDGFENWNLGSVVPPLAGGKVVRSTKGRWLRHQTVRLQTGSAPWIVYSTYDRNLVQEDFSTPLRFARNDVARESSAVRHPLFAYREEKRWI